ncbi:MAG: rhodanese-like domain-containing protein [Thermoleophilia bacterium]|nr:rhodanese-like domain-containing protein [Thermoleophilia bacterium]
MKRAIDPIVSTAWLEEHLSDEGLTVIDVRWPEEYQAGHIPGAISVPFGLESAWSQSTEELLMELPPDEELFKLARECGLTADSKVVIVGRLEEPPAPPYPVADTVRAAVVLMYLGIDNVAILDGGHPKWEKEGRVTTTEVPVVAPSDYSATPRKDMFVHTDYVKQQIGKAVILDGRDPDQYFGASIDPFTDMRGHIPTARSLPMIWVWEKDYTYRPAELIAEMAGGVIAADKDQEIIFYCGVGGYASAWWFLLTQLCGYTNVKIYHGGLEAWVNGKNELVRFTWVR